MIWELNNWLENAIKTQQDKVDEALIQCQDDLKQRSEGQLEAFYKVQNFIHQLNNGLTAKAS